MGEGEETDVTFEEARAVVLRYGYNTNAYLTLSPPPFQFFATPDIDGIVAYQRHGRVWLCGGDPICAEADIAPLVAAMKRAARHAGVTLAFLPVTPRATRALTERLGFDHVKVGEDHFYDVQTWSARGQKMKHIRASINKATREGVVVRRCFPDEVTDDLRTQVAALIARWLDTRGMSALSFLLGVQPLALMNDRRLYLAWRGECVVGFLACSPIPARNGWYLEDIIKGEDAPNGTNELLFQEAMASLRVEGAAIATLGLSALADCGPEHQPPAHQLAGKVFAAMYERLNGFYNFQTLHFHKEKFGPTLTEESFFVWWPRGLWRPRLIRAVVYALDPEGFTAALLSPIVQARKRAAHCKAAQAPSGTPRTEVYSPLPERENPGP